MLWSAIDVNGHIYTRSSRTEHASQIMSVKRTDYPDGEVSLNGVASEILKTNAKQWCSKLGIAMKTRWFTLLLLCLVVGGFTWHFLRQPEPLYQGRPASVWLAQYSRTIGPWTSNGIWPVPTNSHWKAECTTSQAP